MLRNRLVQIGLGIAFLVLIVWWRAGRPPAPPPVREVAILVANRDIQPGEVLSEENVRQVRTTRAYKGALSDWREIEGAYALTFIRKGYPILKTQVSLKGMVARELSLSLHGGLRAMVFETTEAEMPIVREIRKGDTIEIIAVYQPPGGTEGEPYSGTVAQGVEVLDVVRVAEPTKAEEGEQEEAAEGERAAPRIEKFRLVLAVTPDQAERIALARQVAQLHFLLRPRFLPPPSQEVLTVGWNPRELFPGAFPKPKKPQPKEPPKPSPPQPFTQQPRPPSMEMGLPPAPVEVSVEKIRKIVQEETLRQNKELLKAIKRLEAELKKPPIAEPFKEEEKRKVEVIMGTERSTVEVEGG